MASITVIIVDSIGDKICTAQIKEDHAICLKNRGKLNTVEMENKQEYHIQTNDFILFLKEASI